MTPDGPGSGPSRSEERVRQRLHVAQAGSAAKERRSIFGRVQSNRGPSRLAGSETGEESLRLSMTPIKPSPRWATLDSGREENYGGVGGSGETGDGRQETGDRRRRETGDRRPLGCARQMHFTSDSRKVLMSRGGIAVAIVRMPDIIAGGLEGSSLCDAGRSAVSRHWQPWARRDVRATQRASLSVNSTSQKAGPRSGGDLRSAFRHRLRLSD